MNVKEITAEINNLLAEKDKSRQALQKKSTKQVSELKAEKTSLKERIKDLTNAKESIESGRFPEVVCHMSSDNIVYSEHGVDECFEYQNGSGRVAEGVAVGYHAVSSKVAHAPAFHLHLFSDIKYSEYDHDYWDNLELENDPDRVVV